MLNLAEYANAVLAGVPSVTALARPTSAPERPTVLELIDEARATLDRVDALYRALPDEPRMDDMEDIDAEALELDCLAGRIVHAIEMICP